MSTGREIDYVELAKVQQELGHYRNSLRHSDSEIEQRNHIIRALTSFTYQANKLTEPSALLEFALTQALKTSNADAGAIILFDGETKKLTVGAQHELTSELLGILTGQRLDDRATLLMPHLVSGRGALLELTEICEKEERWLLESANLKSLASLPLQAGSRLLGALVVGTRSKASLRPADLHGLLVIAQETAAAWESLQLRDRLWQMAETLLGQGSPLSGHHGAADSRASTLVAYERASHEQWLAELSIHVGASMAAVIALGDGADGPGYGLVATHGLSPRFHLQLSQDSRSIDDFPFDQLRQRNLLVKDLTIANATHAYPLMVGLEIEGARSLIALHVKGDDVDPREKVIIVAATTPGALTTSHLDWLLTEMKAPRPLRNGAPTRTGQSRHLLAVASQASDDEMAMLRSAVTSVVKNARLHARTHEETGFFPLNNLAMRGLNSLLIDK